MEIWKPVVGYESRYEVSNLGRVKSIILWNDIILKGGNRGEYKSVWLYKYQNPFLLLVRDKWIYREQVPL